MVFYCCIPQCKGSGYEEGVSMHQFPRDLKQKKIWKERIRRAGLSTKDDFVITQSTRICSKHFKKCDFHYYDTPRRVLLPVPSTFAWNKTPKRKSPKKRRIDDSEDTDAASENEERVHAQTQTDIPNICNHQFSLQNVIQSNPKMKLMKFYTGLPTLSVFNSILELLVPNKDRGSMIYWDRSNQDQFTCGADYFDSDDEIFDADSEEDDDNDDTSQPFRTHKLSLEDEFLLTLMKLKLGLLNKDLAIRFSISMATVTKICNTWINLMYVVLGSMKIFPHRDIVTKHTTPEFKKQYPSVMLIIDCTEVKIEMPSSLVRKSPKKKKNGLKKKKKKRKSQTYSDYKSANTLKGLIGVDSRGGIMFVSHLYTGGISDKAICQRSGLFDLLRFKLENGELLKNDAIMADKAFTIASELSELGLRLNIPPFLGKRNRLSTADVQDTHIIAQHRIHVERAIGKVRNFHIFDRKLPIKSVGVANQIWTVCCLLTNFQDPIITSPMEGSD